MINFIRKLNSFRKYYTFLFIEKYLHLHITKANYYSPIPEIGKLQKSDFNKVYSSVLEFSHSDHENLLSQLNKYTKDYVPVVNPGLSSVDSYLLFLMIRDKKPKKIVEIGSGFSTNIILSAMEFNERESYPCKLISIEPYPKKFLRDINKKNYELITKKVQEVDQNIFIDADILFIDSTHVSKFNSDVNTEVFEIIPKLKIGAMIHWHDIMIPNDYPEYWIKHGNKFWNESYLVHAFMLYNESFKTIWASRFMQNYHPEIVKKYFHSFNPNNINEQLSSFWVERIK